MADKLELGQIELGEEIGRGGYGVVYKAKVEPFKRDFAVKLLNPSPFHANPEVAKARFIQEAEILMDLHHPYIVPIYGVGEHESKPYILMEYFEGYDLQKAKDNVSVLPSYRFLPFLEFVGEALGYAHKKGVIHRDIKPSNLMTIERDARVIDFGIAKIIDPEGQRYTKPGGTPVGGSFAAPEFLEDPRSDDPRTDIYSLGACWYWLLTGKAPIGRYWEDALESVGDLDESYKTVLFKTLNPLSTRYSTMEEFVEDIGLLRRGMGSRIEEEVSDEAVVVLGWVFQEFILTRQPLPASSVKESALKSLIEFEYSLAVSSLEKGGYIKIEMVQPLESFDEWQGIVLLKRGEEWVQRNHERIKGLMAKAQYEPPF